MAGFGGAVKLEGESEYRKALNQITQNLKEVSAEMRATTSQFDKNDRSAEALAAQSDVLNKKFDEQKRKLSTLEDQYEKMEGQFQENAAAHAKLIEDYDKEKAKLAQIEASLGTTSDEYKAQMAVISQYEKDIKSSVSAQEANERSMSQMRIAINNAKTDVNKTAQEIKNLGQEADTAGDKAEASSEGWSVMGGTIANLASEVLSNATTALKEFVTESQNAYSKFQASTGASATEMIKFKDAMEDAYKSGYGETLEDIGDKMAYIKQVMGETDPTVLGELAENAITLEDTFGSDFRETIRGVTNLMKHFGIDANEAFDLFAKGSQNGLDYTSELGDNIAEYGGNFKQAGYSAEEYFQLLTNGSKGGAYNLDKVNDSINEIKNRLGDGTIGDNITMFNKETQSTFKAWQKGEKTMKDVIDSIVKDISNCESEQEALTKAAKAFGTMGEDANLDVVKSLTTLGNAYEDVEGSMKDLKEIRYDNITSQMDQIGRKIKTDVLAPLAEKLLPVVEDVLGFAVDHGKEILTILGAMAAAFAALKAVSIITSVVQTFTGMVTAIKAASGAMGVLNAVMAANPVGLIITAVGLLTAGVVALTGAFGDNSEAMSEEEERAKVLADEYDSLSDSFAETKKAREEAVTASTAEASTAEALLGKLQELEKVENKSKEQKEKIKQIVDELNRVVPDLALAYDEEKDALSTGTDKIQDRIDKMKELAMVEAYQANLTEIYQEIGKAKANLNQLTDEEIAKAKEYRQLEEELAELMEGVSFQQLTNDQALMDKRSELIAKMNEYDESVKTNAETIESYEGTIADLESQADYTMNALLETQSALDFEEAFTKLKTQADAAGITIPASLETGLRNGFMTMPATMEELQALINFNNALSTTEAAGQKIPTSLSEAIINGKMSVADAVTQANNWVEFTKALKTAKLEGAEIPKEMEQGILSGKTKPADAIKQLNGDVEKETSLMLPKIWRAGMALGEDYLDGTSTGLLNPYKRTQLYNNSFGIGRDLLNKGLSDSTETQSPSRAAKRIGEYYLDGVNNGISNRSKRNSIFSNIWSFGSSLLSNLKNSLKEKSPSKATEEMGLFLLEGLAIGIDKEKDSVIKDVRNVGQEITGALQDELNQNIALGAIQASSDGFNTSNMNMNSSLQQNSLVGAFKTALSQMKVELDGEVAGEFVDKTVTKLIYN